MHVEVEETLADPGHQRRRRGQGQQGVDGALKQVRTMHADEPQQLIERAEQQQTGQAAAARLVDPGDRVRNPQTRIACHLLTEQAEKREERDRGERRTDRGECQVQAGVEVVGSQPEAQPAHA